MVIYNIIHRLCREVGELFDVAYPSGATQQVLVDIQFVSRKDIQFSFAIIYSVYHFQQFIFLIIKSLLRVVYQYDCCGTQ